jgi:hypothetical protein
MRADTRGRDSPFFGYSFPPPDTTHLDCRQYGTEETRPGKLMEGMPFRRGGEVSV